MSRDRLDLPATVANNNAATTMAKRKSGHQLRVETLMRKIREMSPSLRPMPSVPTTPDAKMRLARAKLIVEETLEVLEALGVTLTARDEAFSNYGIELKPKQTKLEFTAHEPDELPHIAKELADLSVVTIGTMSECGICDVPILEEVDANNLGKFGPGGYLDENNKWRKPPNHPTPDLGAVLTLQGWKSTVVADTEVESHEKVQA